MHKLFVELIRRTTSARAQFSGCSSTTNSHSETGQMAVCCQNLFVGLIRRTTSSCAQFRGCSSTRNAHSETGQMAVCCQNLPLGALSSHSAPSVLVGALFKKFGVFLNTGVFRICVLCIHCGVSSNSLGIRYNISHHQTLFNAFTSHCITPVQRSEYSFQATGWTIRGSIRGGVRETLLLSKTSIPDTKPNQLPNRDFFSKAK